MNSGQILTFLIGGYALFAITVMTVSPLIG